MSGRSYVYIKKTKDKYELPIAVADSVDELAEMCGVTADNIRKNLSRCNTGKTKNSMYEKVKI